MKKKLSLWVLVAIALLSLLSCQFYFTVTDSFITDSRGLGTWEYYYVGGKQKSQVVVVSKSSQKEFYYMLGDDSNQKPARVFVSEIEVGLPGNCVFSSL